MCDAACTGTASYEWTRGGLTLRMCPRHDRTHQARLTREGWTRHRLP